MGSIFRERKLSVCVFLELKENNFSFAATTASNNYIIIIVINYNNKSIEAITETTLSVRLLSF